MRAIAVLLLLTACGSKDDGTVRFTPGTDTSADTPDAAEQAPGRGQSGLAGGVSAAAAEIRESRVASCSGSTPIRRES